MNELLEQQRAFAKRIFEGQGYASHDGAGEKAVPKMLALKQGITNCFTDAQRFQIYRNNVFIGLSSALSGVYPVINKLVGDEFFKQAAREYIHQHPADDGNVHVFGEKFPELLAQFPGAEGLAYLPDVARLEWAYHQSFHSPESTVLNVQALAALDESASERLRFQVAEHCHLVSSPYPVLKIWQANQEGREDEIVDLDDGDVQLAVTRSGLEVEFRPLNQVVFAFLRALSENRLFTDACAEAVAIDPDCDIGVILNSMIEQRLLTGFSCLPVETGD